MINESITEKYMNKLEDLNNRTKFNIDKMNDSDKETTITIMRELLQTLDYYYDTQYNVIKNWANLDLEKIRLVDTEYNF